MKVVRLIALCYGSIYHPPKKYSWYSFLLDAGLPQGQSAAERIMSMENTNGTISKFEHLRVPSVKSY
jgi:hypothetical protein